MVRKGLTAKPIASKTEDVKSIQILHALLRSTASFMKVAVHLKAGVLDWSVSKRYQDVLTAAKHLIQNVLLEKTGLRLDFPESSGSAGTIFFI